MGQLAPALLPLSLCHHRFVPDGLCPAPSNTTSFYSLKQVIYPLKEIYPVSGTLTGNSLKQLLILVVSAPYSVPSVASPLQYRTRNALFQFHCTLLFPGILTFLYLWIGFAFFLF